MESFKEFARRKLDEVGDDGVSPPLGNISGGPDQPSSPGDDPKSAFRDLSAAVSSAVSGPSGRAVLSGIVQVVMSDPQVPDRVKTDIQSRVSAKWSHLVDMGEKPVGTTAPSPPATGVRTPAADGF